MPKMKTKKSAAKRFRKTGSGKIVHHQGEHRHLATKKSPKRKRHLRKDTNLSKAMVSRTKKMIQ